MLIFTGDLDDVCPITLTPVRSLKWAVALCEDTDHAYECTALVRWLCKRWRNPLTNEFVASYFVTSVGVVLELTAIGLQNREMAYLVQFALYCASLGFHIEDARFCRQSLYSLVFDARAVDAARVV
jgi:hypothetical protein